MMLLVSMVAVSIPVYAETTTLSAPEIMDTGLAPMSTFSINITVADVSDMFSYQFVLSYDTSVLTATSYVSYDPFVAPWPSEINDLVTTVTDGHVDDADGITKVFYLPVSPIISGSDTVYLDGVPTTAYTMDYEAAKITFDFSPLSGVIITADYQYPAYVSMAYSTIGTGFSTVDPVPIARIDFTVDARGRCALDIVGVGSWKSRLINLMYQPIDHVVVDGYFSNLLLGDADGDGDVDYDDLVILDIPYGSSSGQPAYDWRTDFDRDGDVDCNDLIHLGINYGKSV